jgi:hypothetical protein
MENNQQKNLLRYWPIVFSIWFIQIVLVTLWLVSLPSDSERRIFLGYSAPRLIAFAFLILIACGSTILAIKSHRDPTWINRWLDPANQPILWDLIFSISLVGIFFSQASLIVLRLLAQNPFYFYLAGYANRLSPLVYLVNLIGIELIVWLVLLNRQALWRVLNRVQGLFKNALVVWGILGFFGLFIFFTRLGVSPSSIGDWGGPAVPLLEWQVILALGTGLVVLMVARQKPNSNSHVDSWIVFSIWVVTIIVWLSQPVNPAFFATPPRAPNYEIYPFSDALIYAQNAQSILAGKGMAVDKVPARPLYVVFLAGLHALVGQDYNRVIALQSIVLAVFPAVLYLIGKELSGRPVGISVAMLAVLRDVTANRVAQFTSSLTYSKLYFSEMPAALLLSIFVLISIKWLRKLKKGDLRPLIAGGVLGFATLIRTQAVIALFPVIVIGTFIYWRRWKRWTSQVLLMVLSICLAIGPWIWRNHQVTGEFIIDNPVSQLMVLARRYAGYEEANIIPRLPNESDGQYSGRMVEIALNGLRENPGRIIDAATGHFINNEISNMVLLPIRTRVTNLSDLIWPTQAFWETWNLADANNGMPLFLAYILIFGLGLSIAWLKLRWLGFLPLGVNLSYNLWTALFMSSGSRFLVPVDWIVYLYDMMGLVFMGWLFIGLLRSIHIGPIISAKYKTTEPRSGNSIRPWSYVLVATLILLIGSSIPLSEHVFPDRYPPISQAALWTYLKAQPAAVCIDVDRLESLAANDDLVIFSGRAIYPRYYGANEGEPATAKLGYAPEQQARLVFFLIGEQSSLVVFYIPKVPEFFPNSSDVILVAKQVDGIYNPWLVLVNKDGRQALYAGSEMPSQIFRKP